MIIRELPTFEAFVIASLVALIIMLLVEPSNIVRLRKWLRRA